LSIFNRIQQIENKIGTIEARLNGGIGNPSPLGNSAASSAGNPIANQPGAAQFAGIINSLAEKDKFRPNQTSSVSTVSGRLDSASVQPYIQEAAAAHNVDPALIEAVIKQESAYDPNAESHVGAQGLMQLMPETAADLGVKNRLDPRENVMGGAKYLRQLLDRYDGNMTMAIASYNAGMGNVDHYGGVPPFPETQDYVQKVLNNYEQFKG
jgi:soluble lytic murein transglycosylase-like protein